MSVGAVAVEVNANEHVESGVDEVDPVDNVFFFLRLVDMLLNSQSMMLPLEITFLMSKEQSLWILQMSFKAYSPKPQAQQVWLSIISSLHPTNQLDQDHIQYRIA